MTLKNHALTNRREFLSQSAVAVATGVAAWTLSAQPGLAVQQRARSNRGRIFKATKGGGIGDTPAAMIERLQKLKALGFDGVEGGSPDIRDKQALRDAIREINFPVHGVVDGVHWQSRLSSPDRTEREKGRAALEQAVRDAYDIGGSSVLLVPGRVTGDDENHDHVWHRSIEEVRKVLPLASYFGVHILIETVWNGFCESPEQFRDYIDAFESSWVAAYFDIGNMQKFAPAHQWIRVLGPRIVKLDVKDWGVENGFCKLGEGDVDWPEVRTALDEIGFSGWATREGSDGGDEITARLMDELLDL